ncbi:hypothetical protein M2164_006394 [Streptomyces sp. SAI-208]|uniref:hypothetical protein n=1 Tax=Streptomyces sp. SAI-208 TaxID=2940550 RepID=UPI002475F52F|nr:hypothetical protein [Streptomyces sp. SAI-208]MDH6610759.1 hypothetical protein [Streptomyces sp. SAI-208]
MTGIGPVEPVDSPDSGESYDVIGTDGPRLTDRWGAWWCRMPPRARRITLATTAITLLAAAVLVPRTLSAHPPPAPHDTPVPWPANVTAWRYLGSAGLPAPPGSHPTSGRFRFAVDVHGGPPVTLRVTGAAFTGLTARALPEAFTVHPGTTRRITVEISVSDCSGLPLNADLPFLDVTLRNARAIQHHSFIFGRAYSRDLFRLLRGACAATPPPQPARPTGSAGSQNAD